MNSSLRKGARVGKRVRQLMRSILLMKGCRSLVEMLVNVVIESGLPGASCVTRGVLRGAREALLRDECLGQGKKYFARSGFLAEAEDEVIRREPANEGMERGGEAQVLD